MILRVDDVSCDIGERPVLYNISFEQKRNLKLAIAGETGSGKSTLLKVVAGLVEPRSGSVFFGGARVTGPSEKLVPGHPEIAYLSQYFELQKFLRVEQILDYASQLENEEAGEIFELCEITDLFKRKTDQLSGGEKQRIGLARLLVGKPKLLLLDEPFSNLDPIHKLTLKNVLDKITKRFDITCILVSHDPNDTLPWADEIVVMRGGRILQHSTPNEIYINPVDEYTAGLFGDYILWTPELAAKFDVALTGQKIVRPEAFQTTENGVLGIVNEVRYYGAFTHLVVNLAGSIVVVRGEKNNLRIGDAVELKLGGNGNINDTKMATN